MKILEKQNHYNWMDIIRGVAIVAIFIHHWYVLIIPYGDPSSIYKIFNKLSTLGGTLVQLFFLLSGYGLYLSYQKKGIKSWKIWAKRRITKILLPYWIIVIATFTMAIFIPEISSHGPAYKYDGSFFGLLSYLFLFRNIYPDAWGLNVTFWFMPVIIGLYAIFPFLTKIIEKYGPIYLFIIAFIINYASITLFIFFGLFYSTHDHQRDWFLFYILHFASGMVLAFYTTHKKISLFKMNPYLLFSFGIIFYVASAIVKYLFEKGGFYNDFLTALGAFLIVFSLYLIFKNFKLNSLLNIFSAFGKESYMIYLIHFPFIVVIRILTDYFSLNFLFSPPVMLLTGIFCSVIIFFISQITTRYLNEFLMRKPIFQI
jgi:peptidoglycan/LPS O-acetylase OafA/YrhL